MRQNRVFQNAIWIIGCKIVQALLQLVIGMISARYLGPANYGLLSYAASVTAFALPLMQLGMQSTLVQEYISRPEQEGEILGTSLAMSMLSGLACIIGVVCFTMAANFGDTETIVVCALHSICLVFQAFELLYCWFHAKLLSKYSSLVVLAAYIVVSAYKVSLLISSKNIYWFALSHAVEYGVTGILLLMVYRKIGTQKISVSAELAKDLFSKSRYYILATMMVMVFQNTDHIMVKLIAGDAANGFYAAAITCTSVAGFVYTAIVDSARPAILESRKQSREAFERSMSCLYSLIIYLSILQSVVLSVLAKPVMMILYGEAFLPAVPVLRIEAWILALSNLGAVRNVWILAEEKHHILWVINLCGVCANVVLNVFMIPVWGAAGAAFASVLTQFVTNFVTGFLISPIRRNNLLILRSLHPRYLLMLLSK